MLLKANLRRSLLITQGDRLIFMGRLTLLAATVVLLALMILQGIRRKREKAFQEDAGQKGRGSRPGLTTDPR